MSDYERERAVMDSYLGNSLDATFRGFDASVQKEKFAGPLRSLFQCVYRMGFEQGWHSNATANRPAGIEGLILAAACGSNTEVAAMFDTPEQAHAFVAWLKPFIPAAGDAMPRVADGVPAFDSTQQCVLDSDDPTRTQCPRCKNPHHKCDGRAAPQSIGNAGVRENGNG